MGAGTGSPIAGNSGSFAWRHSRTYVRIRALYRGIAIVRDGTLVVTPLPC